VNRAVSGASTFAAAGAPKKCMKPPWRSAPAPPASVPFEQEPHPCVFSYRMGRDDDAVVDEALKVLGLEGLRVIDSSVMPQVINGNTMAPSLMICEKGADLVRGLNMPTTTCRRPQPLEAAQPAA